MILLERVSEHASTITSLENRLLHRITWNKITMFPIKCIWKYILFQLTMILCIHCSPSLCPPVSVKLSYWVSVKNLRCLQETCLVTFSNWEGRWLVEIEQEMHLQHVYSLLHCCDNELFKHCRVWGEVEWTHLHPNKL